MRVWLGFLGARTGRAREKVQGHREVPWPAGTLSGQRAIPIGILFPIAPVDFQSIGGGGGGGGVGC